MNASQLIILQAILKSSLIIQRPYNSKEVFICFDYNGARNDSWPFNWKRMKSYKYDYQEMFKASIPTNTTSYKLRVRRSNGVVQDSDWLELYREHPTTTNNTINSDADEGYSLNEFLQWYIAVSCSILLIVTCVRELWLKICAV